MDPLHHAFRNSHRYIAAFESTFGVSPLDHAGLTREHSTNGLLAQVPEVGQFADRKMSFQRRFACLTRNAAQPIVFGGGLFSCLHGAPPCVGWKRYAALNVRAVGSRILPKRSPKCRRLSEFTQSSCSLNNEFAKKPETGMDPLVACPASVAAVAACDAGPLLPLARH